MSHRDVASMAAARDPSPTAPPTHRRDGFHLIDDTAIVYDTPRDSQFSDITYAVSTADRVARIAFNRPEVLHSFRPTTIREIQMALLDATEDPAIAVIVLTSNLDSQHYTPAFCAGGDQTVRDLTGYQDGSERAPKLRVLDLHHSMRNCPKPILATVQGYAVGGGHILHMVSDLTIAADNAVFGQTGPRMGSFDAGFGCVRAAQLMGQKRARELWFLCRFYSAQRAYEMGLVNEVCDPAVLENVTAQWVRRIVMNSPTAIAACKASLNVAEGGAELCQVGGVLTGLFYQSEESREGRAAFLEKRAPNFRSKL